MPNVKDHPLRIAGRGAARARRLAAGLALLCGAAAAPAADTALDAARRLLDAGRADQATELLVADLLRYGGDPDYDYLLGQAAYRAGDAGQALFAFERVAMSDPGHIDARLKAAQIRIERGDADYAEALLAALSGLEPNAAQQLEAERLRGKIAAAAGGALALRGYVMAGIGWDDNVTSGPDRATLLIPGIAATPTALGSAARDHDRMLLTEAGLSLRAPLAADTWLTGIGSLRQGDNARRKDAKEGVANLDLGLLRRAGDDFFGVSLLAQDYLLGSTSYRRSLGGRLSWIRPTGAQARMTAYAQHIEFDFPDHAIDNAGRSIVGALRETEAADGASTWQYGAYVGKEKANDPRLPHFSYRLLGLQLGTGLTLRDDLALSAAVIYETHRHLALDGLYPMLMRRDGRFSVGLAADYKLGAHWHLLSRYSHTHNNSNLELYQFARSTFSLQLKWDFDHDRN